MGVKLELLTLKEGHRLKILENRVLRRTFGPKRDEMVEGRRILHNEGFTKCTLPNRMMSRRMRWAWHVACMVRRGMHVEFWWESQKEKDH
jgi:hypothetical protein